MLSTGKVFVKCGGIRVFRELLEDSGTEGIVFEAIYVLKGIADEFNSSKVQILLASNFEVIFARIKGMDKDPQKFNTCLEALCAFTEDNLDLSIGNMKSAFSFLTTLIREKRIEE